MWLKQSSGHLRSHCCCCANHQAVHEHLRIETPDKEVEAVIASVRDTVNAMWRAKQLPKLIQFGCDGKGEHTHSLNGPTLKKVLRDPTLIIDTIDAMAPVYRLMEQGKYELGQSVVKVKVRTQGASEDNDAPVAKKKTQASGVAVEKEVKQRKKKVRGNDFGDIRTRIEEEEGKAGQGGDVETAFSNTVPPCDGVETDESEVSSPNLPDELRDAERARNELSYSQRVGLAFVCFMSFYSKLHEGHDRKASDVSPQERKKLAHEAVEMSVEMQRAFLALIGTHKRRTYAHDFVYGLHQLYSVFSKPWNAATEGSEHAHQKMKKFFHNLACHNGKAKSSCYQVLQLRYVHQQLVNEHAVNILPWNEYVAQRCDKILGPKRSCGSAVAPVNAQAQLDEHNAQQKRKHQSTIVIKGEKKYDVDEAINGNKDNMRKHFKV